MAASIREDLIEKKCGPWYERHKAKFPFYIPLGLVAWYFYGMLLNSLKLGRQATFHIPGQEVPSIWVVNPFKNWFVVFTPFGLGVTAVAALLVCLITKKGYIWFSGYMRSSSFSMSLEGRSINDISFRRNELCTWGQVGERGPAGYFRDSFICEDKYPRKAGIPVPTAACSFRYTCSPVMIPAQYNYKSWLSRITDW